MTSSTTAELDRLAGPYADIVLGNLRTFYPFVSHHVETSLQDRPSPAELHPSFHTAFDWHSCVHMHWLGVAVLEHGLDAARDAQLRQVLAENLSAGKLAVEAAYLRAHPSWERPYGWAWLLRLAAATAASGDGQIRGWGTALAPMADLLAELVAAWTERAEFPVRHGLHSNSAFGLGMMLEAFRSLGHRDGAATCERAARAWFAADTGWAGEWEMSGQDFLSSGLSEAELMARILPAGEFVPWFAAFLPGLEETSRILAKATVTDESDGYLAHLNGLNLSRAGQIIRISKTLRTAVPVPDSTGGAELDRTLAVLDSALQPLLGAGLESVRSEEYMSSHWLASFAWDALISR